MSNIQPGQGAGYNFNTVQEIKSHSSILYNQRMAILFYLLDMKNLTLHRNKDINSIYDVFAHIKQIYKNTRMLLRFNDSVRVSLNLETKDRGIYTIDVALALLEKMIQWCDNNSYSMRKIDIIIHEMDNVEMLIKEILQYFAYFIRPDFSQKPDVDVATEKYKMIADARTVEELREIVGRKHTIDFAALGSERIEIDSDKIEYDPLIDGDLSEYKDDDDDGIELTDEEDADKF